MYNILEITPASEGSIMKRLAVMLIIALSATACAGTGNGETESTETEDTIMSLIS